MITDFQISENCKDFIRKCLAKDPSNRLGSNGGMDEIINHPWFADVNVAKLMAKQIQPEFKPKICGNILDSKYKSEFEIDEVETKITMLSLGTREIIAKENYRFSGFDE